MLKCSNCAAPLPAGVPGATLECRFCHAQTRVPEHQAEQPRVIVVGGPRPGATAQINPMFFLVPIVAGLVLAGGIFFAVRSTVSSVTERVTGSEKRGVSTPKFQGIPTSATGQHAIKPSEIPAVIEKEAFGWVPIDAPGMVGSFASFDPIANAPWAVNIARNWSNDAELESLYLTGVKPDGTLDLTAKNNRDADYRFISRSLDAAQEKMKEVSEKKLVLEFRIMVEAGEVKMLASKPTIYRKPDVGATPPVFACPLGRVLEFAKQNGLAPRPTYSLMARYMSYQKMWGWYVSGDDTSAKRRVAIDATCKLL